MSFKRTRTIILAGLACSLLAIAPVKASIIQGFTTVSDDGGFTIDVSGTLVLALDPVSNTGTIGIISVTLDGTAFGTSIDITASSLGNVNIIAGVIDSWNFSGADGLISVLGFGVSTDTLWTDLSGFMGPATATASTTFFDVASEAPEPATLAIFGLGLAGLGFIRRRRRIA